jgi:predicted transcriptional regulator
MPSPEGPLTPVQYEIMEIVWDHAKDGATVAAVWQGVSARRQVARTTVLNLVDRLEKRGWLTRRQRQGVYRYVAAVSRERTASLLATDFVDHFFGGSASDLIMSLLGGRRLKPDEVRRLQQLLESTATEDEGRKEGES